MRPPRPATPSRSAYACPKAKNGPAIARSQGARRKCPSSQQLGAASGKSMCLKEEALVSQSGRARGGRGGRTSRSVGRGGQGGKETDSGTREPPPPPPPPPPPQDNNKRVGCRSSRWQEAGSPPCYVLHHSARRRAQGEGLADWRGSRTNIVPPTAGLTASQLGHPRPCQQHTATVGRTGGGHLQQQCPLAARCRCERMLQHNIQHGLYLPCPLWRTCRADQFRGG
jgi:hypothetical protein